MPGSYRRLLPICNDKPRACDELFELFAFLDLSAQRLFDQDVFAGLQRRGGQRHVELVGDPDDDRVDVADRPASAGSRRTRLAVPIWRPSARRRSSARSQMAYRSMFRALRQASKCAIWQIGPHPSTPTRSLCSSFFMRVPSDNVEARRRAAPSACASGQARRAPRNWSARGVSAKSPRLVDVQVPAAWRRRRIADRSCPPDCESS